MRRGPQLLAASMLACAPSELAGTTGTSTGNEVTSTTTGIDETPTGEIDDTGTSTGPDGAGTTLEPTTDTSTGTGEPSACAPSDAPDGTLRWSLEGAELPGLVTEIAAHIAGDLVLVGAKDPATQHADVFVQVRDSAGALRWSDEYAGVHGQEDQALGLAVDPAGFIHVLVRETVRVEIGQNIVTQDARLVVLRYAPDGAHVWRWERERELVADGESYLPDGNIGIAGDTVLVLVMRYNPEPTALIILDAAGNVMSDVIPEEPLGDWRGLGPHGLYFLREYETAEIGRTGLDGALAWTAPAPSWNADPIAFLGAQGKIHIAWEDSPDSDYLRHFDLDGTPGPPAALDLGAGANHIDAGAVHCDGTLLLTGGARVSLQDEQLWLSRNTLDGKILWVTDQAFGPPLSYHEGRRVVGMPDGDVLVLANYLDVNVGQFSWLGRFAGG